MEPDARLEDLRPHLKKLTRDLVDKILSIFLFQIPFSEIQALCGVCRKWKEVLLSLQYLLYFHEGKCMIFNPRTYIWESIPMVQFFQAQRIELQRMNLVSSHGGLLCFTSGVDNQFIVCNPLTRRCKRVPSSPLRLVDSTGGTQGLSPTTWRVTFSQQWEGTLVPRKDIAVKGVVSSPPDACFNLILSQFFASTLSLQAIGVHDSRRIYIDKCEIVDVVPRDFFLAVTPTIQFEGSVILGFHACPHGGFRTLAYDIDQRKFQWIAPGSTFSNSNWLAVTLNDNRELEYVDVEVIGVTLTSVKSTFLSPVKDMSSIVVSGTPLRPQLD